MEIIHESAEEKCVVECFAGIVEGDDLAPLSCRIKDCCKDRLVFQFCACNYRKKRSLGFRLQKISRSRPKKEKEEAHPEQRRSVGAEALPGTLSQWS
jgi:hypothetical protein